MNNLLFSSLAILTGGLIGAVSLFAPNQESMLAGLGFGTSFVTGGFAFASQSIKEVKDDEEM